MHRTFALLALTGICPFALAGPPAVTISEIRIDQAGTDNDEFVELAGAADTALDGLAYIVIGDGAGGSGVIESITGLNGQTIPASGFFVMAEGSFTLGTADFTPTGSNPLNFENGDNVTHMLVAGFTGTLNQDLDTDDDGVLDETPWTSILDAVAIIGLDLPPLDNHIYTDTTVGPDDIFVPGHVYRCTPLGDWLVGRFDAAGGQDTPGAANPACPIGTGACCLPLGECAMTTEAECARMNGDYAGDGVECSLIECLIQCPNPDCPSDLTDDTFVNAADLALLLGAWSNPPDAPGCAGLEPCCADINNDGFVNASDLALLLGAWSIPPLSPGCQ